MPEQIFVGGLDPAVGDKRVNYFALLQDSFLPTRKALTSCYPQELGNIRLAIFSPTCMFSQILNKFCY